VVSVLAVAIEEVGSSLSSLYLVFSNQRTMQEHTKQELEVTYSMTYIHKIYIYIIYIHTNSTTNLSMWGSLRLAPIIGTDNHATN